MLMMKIQILDSPHEHEDVPNANFLNNNHEHNRINAHIQKRSQDLGMEGPNFSY